jgi:hypothetical protein
VTSDTVAATPWWKRGLIRDVLCAERSGQKVAKRNSKTRFVKVRCNKFLMLNAQSIDDMIVGLEAVTSEL